MIADGALACASDRGVVIPGGAGVRMARRLRRVGAALLDALWPLAVVALVALAAYGVAVLVGVR